MIFLGSKNYREEYILDFREEFFAVFVGEAVGFVAEVLEEVERRIGFGEEEFGNFKFLFFCFSVFW